MTEPSATTGRKPLSRSEAARHASLVRWGKEQPFAARLAAIREARAKKPKGGGGGKGKGKAAPKAKQTPEQRATLQQAEAARNLADVGDALNAADNAVLGKNGLSALADAARGTEPDGAMADGLIKAGLAERGADGRFRLTADARAVLRGAAQGDVNGVQDTLSKLNDKNLAKAGKEPKAGGKPAPGSIQAGVAGLVADATGKEAEKPKGGGGGGKGGKDKEKEQAAKDAAKEQAKADALTKKEQDRAAKQAQNRQTVQASLEKAAGRSLNAAAFDGLAAFADGGGGDATMLDALAANTGMVEQDSAGGYRMTSEGRAYVRAASSGDVRGAGDAMSRAMDRLKAKADRATSDAARASQDAADAQAQTVAEAQAVIDAANHAAEQRVTQDRRAAGRLRRRARTAKNGKKSIDTTLADYLADRRAEVKQTAQDRAMFANMGKSGGSGGGGGKPSGGTGGLYPKGPDGKRTPQAAAAETRAETPATPIEAPGGGPGGRQTLRAPISGDMEAHARFVQQKQDASAARAVQRDRDKAFRANAKENITKIDAITKELNKRSTSLTRMRELQQQLADIRAGKSLEDNAMPEFDTIALDIQILADDLAAAGDDAALEIKAGARNSASDKAIIQEIYDSACDLCELAVQLGADEGMDDEAEAEDVDGGEVELIEGKDADELINVFSLGSEIKSLGDDTIGGYAVLFGSADTHDLSDQKDYFTKSTDFWLGRFGWPRPITYHHGLDPDTRNDPIVGSWTKARVDDVGVWLEGQLDKAHRYNGAVKELIKRGYLKLSSDSAPQWVQRERQPNGANFIKRWPLITASTTVSPAEPRMMGLTMKSLMDELGMQDEQVDDAPEVKSDERARRLTLELQLLELE